MTLAEPPSTTTMRVALLEDTPATQERFARAISAIAGTELVFAAATLQAMLAWLQTDEPDVLLVDLMLPDGSGLEALRFCRDKYPACDMMVISMFGEEAQIVNALSAGATGYLLKDGTEEDLAQHLKALRAGGSPLSPLIARRLLKRSFASHDTVMSTSNAAASIPVAVSFAAHAAPAAPASATPAAPTLTRRERDVLDLISRGFSYPELASSLNISINTVQYHVKGIYAKLSVHSKTEAVFEARHAGLI